MCDVCLEEVEKVLVVKGEQICEDCWRWVGDEFTD